MKYRFLFYSLASIISISYLVYRYFIYRNPSDIHLEIIVPIAIALITASLAGIYEMIKTNGRYFWIAVKCYLLIPNKTVYVSLSYLIRIKLKGSERYFLVKGNKIDQYQPVGGVYKTTGSKNIYKDWQASSKTDPKNPDDLRFFVKAKYLPDVLKWFQSGKDREIGIWREFYEELILDQIITPEHFKYIKAERIKIAEKLLVKENRFNNEKYHTLIYEIFDLELNQFQFEEFNTLLKKKEHSKKYAFVTEDEILKECFNNGKKKIGQHTKHII